MMDKPEVTQAMLDAAAKAFESYPYGSRLSDMIADIYRAMRLARPLAEGPGA